MNSPMSFPNTSIELYAKETFVKNRREEGMALITALLILLLMSTMIVGLSWLVTGDQRLGGNNNDRQLAYYGAEAGMEQLTASLENAFDSNYALNATAINALVTTPGPPTNIPNVKYLLPGSTTNGSGYAISFTPSASNANLPASGFSTIPTGPYAGLVGLATPYTLQVTAHTTYGSEVKLQREVQTVGVPVFQFGMFSQTDLSFFAGPAFNFGGRVHSNGNLWLASQSTLTMGSKVTAVGQVITSNLENGWSTSNYTGPVYIPTSNSTCPAGPSTPPCDLTQQSPAQSVSGTNNYYGSLGSYVSGFGSMASSVYTTNYLNIGPMNDGVTTLNLAIATPSIGGQTIDMIRRPVNGEDTANPGKLAERYYSQVSLRILLSDYDSNGACTNSDISSASSSATKLPELSTNLTNPVTPIDLATLGWDTVNAPPADSNTKLPYYTYPSWITSANVGKTIFPLPTSYAQGTTYNANNGYWVTQYYPTITGCIKIDYQTTAGGAWTDVTNTILNLGYTGRNIDPQVKNNGVPQFVAPTNGTQPSLTGIMNQVDASGPTANTGVTTVGCTDPSPSAVIRLARLRDNPSNAVKNNNYCGNNPSTDTGWSGTGVNKSGTTCIATQSGTNCPTQSGTDFWPNVLYDTREGLLQDVTPTGSNMAVAGAMYYVELDVKNLAACLTSTTICPFSSSVNNTTGYSVYFSDRRGERPDPNPPASVGTTSMLTGGFGYEDNVNFVSNVQAANGCPNNRLDPGEDVESDYNSSNVSSNTATLPRTYGNILSTLTSTANPSSPASLWPIYNNGLTTAAVTGTDLGGNTASPGKAVYNLMNAALKTNTDCNSQGITWPFAWVFDPQDLRENPPIFFRRALKIVDGDTISLGTCNSVPCGLTIVSENPVYLQGDYNNPGLNTGFTSTADVGASIVADAFTFLSDNWNDVNSFAFPYGNANNAADTTYRMAVAAGKGIPWENTNGTVSQDFGTDGGAHNFLRYIENWGNNNLWYEGSIVSMFYNHQAVGTFKCCTNVYSPPTRQYQFDTNFLTPSELPPLTPMLRLVNTIGSTQMILPTD